MGKTSIMGCGGAIVDRMVRKCLSWVHMLDVGEKKRKCISNDLSLEHTLGGGEGMNWVDI